MKRLMLLALFLFGGCNLKPVSVDAPPQTRQTLTVAAAADLKFAFDEIVTEFQKAHTNIEVRVNYGSSGNFYAQLAQRAPFDVFLSADVSYPERLIDAGLGAAESKFVYAVGRIVVWVPSQSPIDPVNLGMESLRHPSVRRIAVANPDHAPYGKSAIAAMQKLGVYDSVKGRLIFAENVAQAAQFVTSGSADIGIISASLAVAPAMKNQGRFWEIPLDAYDRMEQGGVILAWSRQLDAAQALRSFVMGSAGKTILRRHGFAMPTE
jgi:molybdate transport system substrate-binding protein